MLIQRLLLLLPEQAPVSAWVWYAVVAGAGLLLWLAGSRVSRPLVCLTLVAVGAIAGKLLPAQFGWHVDPMAGAVVGAGVLGVLGYAMHRWVIGFGLGVLLALWTAAAVWVASPSPTHWAWQPYTGAPTVADATAYLKLYAAALGPDLTQQIAGLAGLALITGLGVSILFPRTATNLFWVLLGATLAITASLAGSYYLAPHRIDRLPTSTQGQLILLAAFVAVGFAAQWWQGGKPVQEKAPERRPQGEPAVA